MKRVINFCNSYLSLLYFWFKQNRANFKFSQLSWRTVKSTYRYLHRVGNPYFVLPILCQCFKKIHIFKNFAVKKCQDKFTNISVPRSSLFNFDTSLSKLVVTTSQRSNLKKIIHLAPPIIGLNIFFRAFSFWLFFSNFHKTCSCPLVKYFCTLFWDDIMMIWDDNIVYFFNWEKKTCFGPIRILVT